MRNVLAILRVTMHHSLIEMFATYPPRIYLMSWVPRVLTQVAFFAVMVGFIGGPDALHYAIVGNALHVLAATVVNGVTASVTWEKRTGTLPLLVASPTSPLLIFTGRNIGMATHGTINGLVGMYVVAPLLGVPLSLGQALSILPLLLATALGGYGMGLLLGSIALYARGYHNVLSNIGLLTMLVASGVNYPVTALPQALQVIAQLLPLTRGLAGVRAILAGASLPSVLPLLLGELAVGAAYALGAQLLIGRLLHKAREAGTLEYH